MIMNRAAGILMHPTSLPGSRSTGCLGAAADRFLEFLCRAGQSLWQILPLGPTGYGDSPYSGYSAFAGNHLLIDLDLLQADGLLTCSDIPARTCASFRELEEVSLAPLMKACRAFGHGGGWQSTEYETFENAHVVWLPDYTLFRAIKASQGGRAWYDWPNDLRNRHLKTIESTRRDLKEAVDFHRFLQFQFSKQWSRLRRAAREKGIRIIGDMPIFVAEDSADVWAHPDLFDLTDSGRPAHIAGVPPDYFSRTGQRWGNPLYRWDRLARDGYSWWMDRFRVLLGLVDIIRVDHFRGFDQYWSIPASDRTAQNGHWEPGPGADFFSRAVTVLPDLPLIAEDLGVITPDVTALRDRFAFPGMKILQFAFGSGPGNDYLPHNYSSPRCVVYTGTHDNDTIRGWYRSLRPKRSSARRAVNPCFAHLTEYLAGTHRTIHWDLIDLAMSSVAAWAIVPAQDIMGLGSEARMNLPGRAAGNWTWHLDSLDELDLHSDHLLSVTGRYNRRP